jgi:predicted acylesterase/phospholipase RssA
LAAAAAAPRSVRKRLRRKRKVALVCAGGGITGAVYEIGCLRALEDLLDRSMLDLDLYVGISGGAFVASLLANGLSPRQLYDEVAARSRTPFGVAEAPLFRLGLGEYLKRTSAAPRVIADAVLAALSREGRSAADAFFTLFQLLPPGLLDNSGVQEYLARLFRDHGRTDHFRDLHRELIVVAVDLDTGDAVPFGEKGWRDVSISKAVQASTALPGLYRPIRIGGRDYVDGGVKKTAHINLAIQRGADLVICLNPIVPILNNVSDGPLRGHLSNRGPTWVLDQVLRITLHGRMQYGLERYQSEHPEVDILIMQPTRDDMRMFRYNIMRYSARHIVAQHGYRSAKRQFVEREAEYRALLKRHGIGVGDPHALPDVPDPIPWRSSMARHLGVSLDQLAHKLAR